MPKTIPSLQENKKKLLHRRNSSDELHVFDVARCYEGANTTLTHGHYMREGVGRLSLDIQNNKRNSIPLQSMMMDQNPMTIKNEKKYKQPSSPGGRLAHFLNSLLNQSSSKKAKSKSTASTQSVKDEDESPGGRRRKRMSGISLFRSGNSNINTSNSVIVSDTHFAYSGTPPPYHTPQAPTMTNSTTYKYIRSYLDHKNACQATKRPINETHKKNDCLYIKSGFSGKQSCSENGVMEKIRVCDVKHDNHHRKYNPTREIREFKRFSLDEDDDDDGGDSDSSSDLFELTNWDLGYDSSGLSVFGTTSMDSINTGAPIYG